MQGGDGAAKAHGEAMHSQPHRKFHPGRLVWGKVEGHEWWPASVVRRRAVPFEVWWAAFGHPGFGES